MQLLAMAQNPIDQLPQSFQEQVRAYVKVNNGRWLSEKINAFEGALGTDGQQLRAWFTEGLYLSGSMRGLDLNRPSLLAWRDGNAPLIAIIPIADRRLFLQEFGVARELDTQLIRVGEQDGTLVYSQNTVQGLWEYRLLVGDQNVYLARTAEECKALEQVVLDIPDLDVPLEFMATHHELDKRFASRLLYWYKWNEYMPRFPLQKWWKPYISNWLAGIRRIRGKLHLRGEQVTMSVLAEPKANTELAAWITRQRNESTRLLPIISQSTDILQIHGHFVWQGELAALGRPIVRSLPNDIELASEDEYGIRNFFGLLDRRGPFVLTWGVHNDSGAPYYRRLSEQPRPAEFLSLSRIVDSHMAQNSGITPGDFGALVERVTYSREVQDRVGLESQLLVAGDEHVINVGATSDAGAEVSARSILNALDERHTPVGEPGLLVARIAIHQWLAHYRRLRQEGAVEIPECTFDAIIKSESRRNIALDIPIPFVKLLSSLHAANPR